VTIIRPIARVISVCSKKDIATWSVVCKNIVRFIDANEYLIVVPDHEVDLFHEVTCESYKVIPESFYIGNLKSKLKEFFPPENRDRIGWYLQQFIKITAAKETPSSGNVDEVVLIWDADTLPLKKLCFFDENGVVSYYSGVEAHTPYFGLIKRVLPWVDFQPFSFIAQCFPAKISWVQEFCKELESDGRNWIEAIICNIDKSQRAGFSEYESLGNYIWSKYPNQVMLNNNLWERNGLSLIGNPSGLTNYQLIGLARYFDYISFEGWDIANGFRASVRSWRNRLKFAKIGRKSPVTLGEGGNG
jgi:hypothetical protein